jgi:hypothetical protein
VAAESAVGAQRVEQRLARPRPASRSSESSTSDAPSACSSCDASFRGSCSAAAGAPRSRRPRSLRRRER